MVEVGSIRKGMALIVENEIYFVLDVNKHFTGRGSGIIRTKLKNIKTGYVREFKFNSGEKVEEAALSLRKTQFLYRDGPHFHFMDLETFEQYVISEEEIGDSLYYIKEGMETDLQFHDMTPIGVVLPNAVVLEVVDTAPSHKGDTVTGGGKPAVCDTGLKLSVPFFIEVGQKIRVDTRTGEYLEKA